MFITMLTAALAQAAAVAAPAAPAAPVAAVRPLRSLPNTTITYYDIQGKNNAAIKKSLDEKLADPAQKAATQLFGWDVAASITKRTEGTKCTVQNATAKLTSTVHLPRLAEEAKVDKPSLANWQAFAASVEEDAASNLWFISDRLPTVEKAVVGVDCSKVQATWDAAMAKVQAEQRAFAAQRTAAAAAARAARAAKPAPAPAQSDLIDKKKPRTN